MATRREELIDDYRSDLKYVKTLKENGETTIKVRKANATKVREVHVDDHIREIETAIDALESLTDGDDLSIYE